MSKIDYPEIHTKRDREQSRNGHFQIHWDQMKAGKVHLEKLKQEEYNAYFPDALKHLAEEIGRARDLSPEDALTAARQSFDSLLPEGRIDSPDQYLSKIMANGNRVGVLWFGIRRDKSAAYAFIWDIEIHLDYRGKGFGEQAMLALETKVKELGLTTIGLNVFGQNATAIRLYQKLGYRTASMAMVKNLTE